MSGDFEMLDAQNSSQLSKPGPSSRNSVNGRLNGNGRHVEDSSMSEDDDMPLSQTTRTKSEPATPDLRKQKRKRVQYNHDSSDDDKPLASTPVKVSTSRAGASGSAPVSNGVGKKQKSKGKAKLESSDSEDDAPLVKGKGKRAVNGKEKKQPPRKKVKKSESGDDAELESEDDKPIVKETLKRKRKGKQANGTAVAESSDDDKPLTKSTTKKTVAKKVVKKEESGTESTQTQVQTKKRTGNKVKKEEGDEESSKKGKKKEGDEDDEEVFKWWEQQNADGDGSIKWQTLEHNGVCFPQPYEPLPKGVKMKYAGKTVDLPPLAEEVAGFYAALLETEHAQDSTFNGNFFDDFLKILKKNPPRDGTKITSFEQCDFRPMFEHFEAEKAKKKSLTTAEKKEIKAAKDQFEAPYTHCTLDGRKEKVGNFRIEPPGLFRGRGGHPKKGALKFRLRPEDITINIGQDAPVPVPNVPGKWKAVIHDQTVTWLANWTENVNGNHKYVFLAAGSSLKGQSDMSKFEKARELKKHVDRIRKDYTADLKNKMMQVRQRATAMYFIDRLALRAGNEKGDDEADTVGCCSLRCEHVTLEPPHFIIFDFLGKDSIRYYNRVQVDAQVFKNIKIFKNDKLDDDDLFDRVNTSVLNKHLTSYMKGLTAKVFRTYNASITFQEQLDQGTPVDGTVQEKLAAYNSANRMVAILCNHQRAVPKTHEQSMGKMRDKLRGFKYERRKLRHALFAISSKFKKDEKYAEDESDLDEDGVVEHEEQWRSKEIERTEKKFQKENEKLVEEGKEAQDDSVLQGRIENIEVEFQRLVKERGTGKAELKREKPAEKIEEAIEKLDDKIKAFRLQMEDREAGKEVALGTSKINYLDPRITAAWCKQYNVPIEKLFSKTLLTKFPWAMEVEGDWKF